MAEIKSFVDYCEQEGVRHDRQLTAALAEQYLAHRRATDNLQAYTLHNHGIILKTWLKRCREQGVITVDPLADWKLEEPRRSRQATATLAQVDAVLGKARGPLVALLATLAFAGLRIGEAQALRKRDVDLEGGWIEIVSHDDWQTKTAAGERKIPMHPRLQAILQAMPPAPGPLMFTAPPSAYHPKGGHPINPRQINVQFKTLAQDQGFDVGRGKRGLVVHSLRHFFKTSAINAGVPKPLVDHWVGHQDKNSMDAVYFHPNDEASTTWMSRVPFGDVRNEDLQNMKEPSDEQEA